MKDDLFDIRDLEYFQNKNIFSGSVDNFRYKLIPNGENIEVIIWLGKLCLESSEILEKSEFSMTEEGVCTAIEWIKQKYKENK